MMSHRATRSTTTLLGSTERGEGASPARSAVESSPPEVHVWYPSHPLVIQMVITIHTHNEASKNGYSHVCSWSGICKAERCSLTFRTAPHTQPLHTAVLGAVPSIQTFMSAIDHPMLMFDQNITT